MRKVAVMTLAVALVALATGVQATEVVGACAVSFAEVDPNAEGEPTPEAAIEEALPSAEVPASTEDGISTEQGAAYLVEPLGEGYALTEAITCETSTVLSFGDPASAHDPDAHYNTWNGGGLDLWPGSSPSVTYHFTDELSGAQKRARIAEGFEVWEASIDLSFDQGGDHSDSGLWQATDCQPMPDNDVHWQGGFPSGTIGWVTFCENNQGNIGGFAMGFDEETPWNVTTDAPGGSEWDLLSFAVHEAGHATGFSGHWQASSTMCDGGSGYHTMCGGLSAGLDYWRDLAEHDEHTASLAYPA